MSRLLATAFVLSLNAASVAAGPVADFEAAYDTAYASYRTALFATNTGDAAKSIGALQQLDRNWTGLMAQYRASPPPQFEDDPLWDETTGEVRSLLDEAKTQAAEGDLALAHETLEGIREVLGSLHARNDVETFSDRMNAYHAEMEAIIGVDTANMNASVRQSLLERAAVLGYLATDVLSAPPASAAGNPDFAPLAAALQTSVDNLLAAARSGDDAALLAAIGALKVPYSKLFLKFG